jgi:hypothetical protein
VKKFFCGPESFTPDLAPCVGESPEIKNYFVAAGKCDVCSKWALVPSAAADLLV